MSTEAKQDRGWGEIREKFLSTLNDSRSSKKGHWVIVNYLDQIIIDFGTPMEWIQISGNTALQIVNSLVTCVLQRGGSTKKVLKPFIIRGGGK